MPELPEGRRLEFVGRKGKQLWLKLDKADEPMPLMHFGMTGFIAVKDAAEDKVHVVAYENAPSDTASNWPPRFLKLLLHFGPHPSSGSQACELAFCDARRFGRVKLVVGDPAQCSAVSKLGFDPLLEMPDEQRWQELLTARGRKGARLKPLLLDQSFCAGVGNWVADEVLWQARLHPEQLVAHLTPGHMAELHKALRKVVQMAVEANADSSRFPKDWMFHVRWGKRAGTLAGHRLDHITVGSRTSCYVPALQKKIIGVSDDNNDDGGGGDLEGAAADPGDQPAPAPARKKGSAGRKRKGAAEEAVEQIDQDREQKQEHKPAAACPQLQEFLQGLYAGLAWF
eukprot:gene12959-13088_t